jgi:hypothetical protein
MQLIATYKISGVSKVIAGKGKGTTVAQPGDLFVPYDDESGAALLADGNASKPGATSVRANTGVQKPVETDADDLGSGDSTLLNAPPAKPLTKAEKAAAAKAEKAAAAKAKKAADEAAKVPTPDASLEDLGLGDDDGEEDKVE